VLSFDNSGIIPHLTSKCNRFLEIFSVPLSGAAG